MNFITPEQWQDNVFRRIEKDWMLITVANEEKCNTMTASFGGFGVLFFKNVAHIYVRPSRFTYSLLEQNENFSLSFFNGEKYRSALQYCGKASGRNENKFEACGLSVRMEESFPVIEQADVSVLCRKIYAADLNQGTFFDPTIQKRCYPEGDTHRLYIGEIIKIGLK